MAQGDVQVEDNGTLILVPHQAPDPEGLEVALSRFADRTSPSETPPRYRLSAASVWRARRAGLSLETIVQTLEAHSGRELPPKVHADLTLWSQQIDRLRLEVEQDRLVLRSPNPLVITAVMRHRSLSHFVTEQLDATTAVVQAETYPELIDTFDACRYPVLDHVPSGWTPETPPPAPRTRRLPTPARAAAPRVRSRGRRLRATQERQAVPLRCQAITKRGRQCKNRVRPKTPFCRVHTSSSARPVPSLDSDPFSPLSLSAYLATFNDGETLNHVQLARSRVCVLMGINLGAWLLDHLLRAGLMHGFGGVPTPWLVSGVAVGLSCIVVGRLLAGMGVVASFGFAGLNLLSMGLDCLHKEGLIVNLCFVVIPVLLPLWGLSQVDLSWAWVFLCFPVGLGVGQLVYTFLETMSS